MDLPVVVLAVVNTPDSVVLSGPVREVELVQEELEGMSVTCQRVHVTRAFHSPMMEQAKDVIIQRARKIELHQPATDPNAHG